MAIGYHNAVYSHQLHASEPAPAGSLGGGGRVSGLMPGAGPGLLQRSVPQSALAFHGPAVADSTGFRCGPALTAKQQRDYAAVRAIAEAWLDELAGLQDKPLVLHAGLGGQHTVRMCGGADLLRAAELRWRLNETLRAHVLPTGENAAAFAAPGLLRRLTRPGDIAALYGIDDHALNAEHALLLWKVSALNQALVHIGDRPPHPTGALSSDLLADVLMKAGVHALSGRQWVAQHALPHPA